MTECGRGSGLMLAGILVILVWLGIVVLRTLELPRYGMPVVVGTALLVADAILRASQRRQPWRRT